MNQLDKKIIDRVIASFKENPDEWIFPWHFSADNPSEQIEVWLANGISGLHVKVGNNKKIGDLTFMSFLFGSFIPWRRRVWNVFKPAQRKVLAEIKRLEKENEPDMEAWANRPVKKEPLKLVH